MTYLVLGVQFIYLSPHFPLICWWWFLAAFIFGISDWCHNSSPLLWSGLCTYQLGRLRTIGWREMLTLACSPCTVLPVKHSYTAVLFCGAHCNIRLRSQDRSETTRWWISQSWGIPKQLWRPIYCYNVHLLSTILVHQSVLYIISQHHNSASVIV